MNKDELLQKINKYEARSKELIGMFVAESDINKARIYLEESKCLAITIDELKKSYERIVAREKRTKKAPFVNRIRDIVMGLR